jgi:hypothetical protein
MNHKSINLLAALVLLSTTVAALAGDATTAVGTAIGAAAGAAIGEQSHGRQGAVLGGAVGGAVGAAVSTKGSGKTGAVLGGAAGGAAGAAVGYNVGGTSGAVLGAGVGAAGGAVIGKNVTENDRVKNAPVGTASAVFVGGSESRKAGERHRDGGNGKQSANNSRKSGKKKNCGDDHPGRGHAYGKYKDC